MTVMAKHSKRVTGDAMRRTAMWILASGVAAIAAIVSYSHIYDLGRAHGGTGVPARLLPLSVDMLILVGELMLLHEADGKGRRFVLGGGLVWSGLLATLAANVAFGAQFGVVGAVIWGWPAYSFVLAAWGMVAVVKRTTLARETEAAEPADVTSGAALQVISEVTPEVSPAPSVQVTPEPVSGQPGIAVQVRPQVRPKRKTPVRPPRISDADLKKLVRAEFDKDRSVSVIVAAKNLNRGRDRVAPLLKEVRREAGILTMERKQA